MSARRWSWRRTASTTIAWVPGAALRQRVLRCLRLRPPTPAMNPAMAGQWNLVGRPRRHERGASQEAARPYTGLARLQARTVRRCDRAERRCDRAERRATPGPRKRFRHRLPRSPPQPETARSRASRVPRGRQRLGEGAGGGAHLGCRGPSAAVRPSGAQEVGMTGVGSGRLPTDGGGEHAAVEPGSCRSHRSRYGTRFDGPVGVQPCVDVERYVSHGVRREGGSPGTAPGCTCDSVFHFRPPSIWLALIICRSNVNRGP